jgi:cytochrome c556
MRRLLGAVAAAAYLIGLTAATVAATTKADRAAYNHRKEVMKQLGRSLYVSVGKVVTGELQYGPETVAGAEETVRTIPLIPTLFQPGSDLPESHLKANYFDNKARADATIADVNKQAEALVPAVKTGDKAKIATAYQALYDACNSCHIEFRKPYN